MKKCKHLTCADCKHSFVDDLFHEWCCSIKKVGFRYSLIPVTKYGNPFTKCKKFEVDDELSKS